MCDKLFSLGLLVERLRVPPGRIEREIERLGIRPQMTLNNLEYYAADDETRLAEVLCNQNQEQKTR